MAIVAAMERTSSGRELHQLKSSAFHSALPRSYAHDSVRTGVKSAT
jgi:hypothetical protein